MILQIKKISKDNFSLYGQLISPEDIDSQNINEETTKSFYDLVNIEVYGDDKQCRVNIFKSQNILISFNGYVLKLSGNNKKCILQQVFL